MGSRQGSGSDDTGIPASDEAQPGGPGGETARHLRSRRTSRWLKISAAVVACGVLAVSVFAGIQMWRLQSNLATAPLDLSTSGNTPLPPDPKTDPLQILVIGTDTRTGNPSYGSTTASSGYGHADVMLLMHLSADRERVTVLSFPRDLMVPLPSCKDPRTGSVSPSQPVAQLNSSLSFGGPGCTVAAINQLTGLNIDHFMMADFNAVTELSRTLGGVNVCLTHPVRDGASNLSLPAGVTSIEGRQALAFLRTRHGFGDGSDLARIRAQQGFLSSMARKIKDNGTLSDLPRLYSIAETVTRNVTVDAGLSKVGKLVSTATRLNDVDLSEVAFVTVPNGPWTPDPARLQLTQPAADRLFATLRADGDVTADDGRDQSAAGAPEPSAHPAKVVNAPKHADGNNLTGLEGQTADEVTCQG